MGCGTTSQQSLYYTQHAERRERAQRISEVAFSGDSAQTGTRHRRQVGDGYERTQTEEGQVERIKSDRIKVSEVTYFLQIFPNTNSCETGSIYLAIRDKIVFTGHICFQQIVYKLVTCEILRTHYYAAAQIEMCHISS